MKRRRNGITLLEVLITVLLIGGVTWVVSAALIRAREEGRWQRCRSHLSCMAHCMRTYLNEYGNNQWYPCPLGRGLKANDYSGAEWLASVHWVGTHPGGDCFVCPSSGDTNHDGRDLGTDHAVAGQFGSQTVSYAAMHYYSLTDGQGNPMAGAIKDNFPPLDPMACDDTEGTLNHGDTRHRGMNVLMFDSHVEFWPDTRIDPLRAVGMKGGPLSRLRN